MISLTATEWEALTDDHWYGFAACAIDGRQRAAKAEYPTRASLPEKASCLGDLMPITWFEKAELYEKGYVQSGQCMAVPEVPLPVLCQKLFTLATAEGWTILRHESAESLYAAIVAAENPLKVGTMREGGFSFVPGSPTCLRVKGKHGNTKAELFVTSQYDKLAVSY